LKLNLFQIKYSYIAHLKRDKESIERNPKTINRISGKLYEMGLAKQKIIRHMTCFNGKFTN